MEYKNSDILLYSVKNNKIVVIYDDKEKMEKYLNTNDSKYAPVKVFAYSKDLEHKFSSEMKKIAKYEKISDSEIKVFYKDGTEYTFANSNLETIKNIKHEQDNLNQERKIEDFVSLAEKDKNDKKVEAAKKWKKGLAGALAAIAILSAAKHGGPIIDRVSASLTDTKPTSEDTSLEMPTTFVGDETKVSKEKLQTYAKNLYNDITNKNTFVLTYQQVAGVNVNEDLAYSIVELINGIYPSRLTTMTDEQEKEEMVEIREAIELINAGNLNPATESSKMINLADYIENSTQKALVNNALIVARRVVSESIGEPVEGKIMEEYQSINVFSKEYTNAIDQLLNYEWETINSTEFLQAPTGTRSVVTSIWQNINASIPQWAYVVREASEYEPREHNLYYRYFIDEAINVPYYPRESASLEPEYVKTWEDEKGCHEEIYTEAEMFAMAGLPYTAQVQDTGIEINPNIHQLGIEVEVANRTNEQDTILYNGKEEIVVISSNTNNEESKETTTHTATALKAGTIGGLLVGGAALGAYGILNKKEEEENKTK